MFVAWEWRLQRSVWKALRKAWNTESTREAINKEDNLHPNTLSNALQETEWYATPHLILAQLEQLIPGGVSSRNILTLDGCLYWGIGQGLVPNAFVKSLS